MQFKKTAALGLSALLLGSNAFLPYSPASTISVGSHASNLQALASANQNPALKAMAEQQLQHPVQPKHSLLGMLNPMNLILHPRTQAVKTAKTIPVRAKSAVAMPLDLLRLKGAAHELNLKSIPVKGAILSNKQALALQLKANRQQQKQNASLSKTLNNKLTAKPSTDRVQPLNPKAMANTSLGNLPLVAAQTAEQAPLINTSANLAATQTASANQPLLPDELKPMPDQGMQPMASSNTPDTIYPSNSASNGLSVPMVAQKRTPEETFQMLAASPLEKLAMQTKGTSHTQFPAPSMDFTHGNNVKVLKSSITQKATNVDIAVGKAEVIYLSRPASRVSVSNPDVASAVIISPTQIQLVGKSVGVANLLVWGDMMSPDHTVVDISVHRDVSVLVNQLKYIDPGIQIAPMAAEDTIILSGQAESRESAQLAIEMAKAFFSKGSTGSATSAGSSGAMGSSASGGNTGSINSQAPGSALPGGSANIINLIKVKGEPSTKLELVRQKVNDIDPNIQIDVVPGPDGMEKVILSGRVASASIASKALNLVSVFYGKPGLKIVTGQGGNDFTRLEVNSTSSSSGGSSTATTKSGSEAGAANILQGSVMTDATGNVISMLEVAQKPQIRCSIKFLELNKSTLDALGSTVNGGSGNTYFGNWSGAQSAAPAKPLAGLSTQDASGSGWTSSASGSSNGTNAVSKALSTTFNQVYQNGITQVFSINDQFAVALQALQEKRQVRTLAEPTLTMLSGEPGSFLAGGEIPIAFLGGNGQISIEFKEYGIRLNLLPTVTDDGKIQMQVAPEVSTVDQSINIQGVPGFTTRRMNTNLIVNPGQSFVLAGLFRQEDTDSVSRFPGIGTLPIIGPFFRNKWKNHTSNEMVVLIRPEIIYSQTGATQGNASMGSLPDSTGTAEISKK